MRALVLLLVVVVLLAGGAFAALELDVIDGSDDGDAPIPLPPPVTKAAPERSVPDVRLAALPNGPLIGLADNRPETILDPRFQQSGIKRVRVLVPYDDVARRGVRIRYLDAWFETAKGQGIEPLVSFYRSYRSKHLLPSVREYRRNFRLFRKRYPWVRYFSTWDEANFSDAQPTGKDPVRTARFYRVARDECSRDRCTVITADFRPDGTPESAEWLRQFKRHMGPGPHIWGLVGHPDVTRLSTEHTDEYLRSTRGPVWITEVGAVHFFGRGIRPSIPRQTRRMRFLMSEYAAVSPRIERMYVYHWRAAQGDTLWDSGLLSVDGRPRPAYGIFFEALGRPAPT